MKKKDKNTQGSSYTKAQLLFYLYNIHLSYLSEIYHKDYFLPYRGIVERTAKRIEREPLEELCNFLNVSTSAILEGVSEDNIGQVYISNKDIFIDFDLYLFLRSTKIVVDQFNESKTSIIHDFNFSKISENKFDSLGIDYLIKKAKSSKLIESSRLRLINNRIRPETKDMFAKEVYRYISKFVTKDEFKEKAKTPSYKKIIDSVDLNTKD